MPRTRKQPARSAVYQRRNERARALGYRSYYDYRTHDNGRLAPDQPRPKGQRLKRLRGHASAQDLIKEIKQGELVLVDDYLRDRKTGRYRWVDLKVLDRNSRERIYRLRDKQLEVKWLRKLVKAIDDKGAVISPNASFDLRKLVSDIEAHEAEDRTERELRGQVVSVRARRDKVIEVTVEDQ